MTSDAIAVAPAAADDPDDRRRRILAIVGSSSGNLVEWYDFYCAIFFYPIFAPIFFPNDDPTSQSLKAAGVIAVGFFMRPIGGWLFGRLADRLGRRDAMVISVLMMCAASLFNALLPGYATVGVLAPILLLAARLFQGLSVGGEYGTSATYMSEVAARGSRGFYASFQYVTLIGGQLLASLVLVVLQIVLTEQQLADWGWRIPFALGAVAAVVALFLRRSLAETASQDDLDRKESGTFGELAKHWRAFCLVLAFTAGGSLSFYTFTTYMPKYLVGTAHIDPIIATRVTTVALLTYMLLQPAFGALSDRIGRKTSMLLFGSLGTLACVPLMHLIGATTDPLSSYALIMTALLIVSFYTGINGIVKAELFPARIRALGVGVSYAIANSVFGGTAETAALWFKKQGIESAFFWYVTAMVTVAFVASLVMPNPRRHGYLDGDGTVEEALGGRPRTAS